MIGGSNPCVRELARWHDSSVDVLRVLVLGEIAKRCWHIVPFTAGMLIKFIGTDHVGKSIR